MRALIELRWSILALAVALILALAGMGALGAMLYYACTLVIRFLARFTARWTAGMATGPGRRRSLPACSGL